MFTSRSRTNRHPLLGALVATAALVLAIGPLSSSPAAPPSDSPLAATFAAHGGLDRWRAQRVFTYELVGFPLSPQVARPNRSTVDLKTRHNRIEGDGFVVGWNGRNAWSVPDADAVGLPPRFFALGSFYFIGMPFVFADDGVVLEDRGLGTFDGKSYRVVSVGYERGTGHSSEDDYTLFIDPETDRLALINHSVTEIGVERVTWVFDAWQEIDGLLVPSRMTYHEGWNPESPGDGATFTIEDATLSRTPPDRTRYDEPEGATIASDPADH